MNLHNYCEAKSCLIFAFDNRILQRQKIKIWKPGSLQIVPTLSLYDIFYFQALGEQMFLLCFVYKNKGFLLPSFQREFSIKNSS